VTRPWTGYIRKCGSILGSSKRSSSSPVFRLALWSTQPPIQYVTQVSFPGAKQLKHEADHSPTSSAKVKKYWSYTFSPPYAFMPNLLLLVSSA